MTVAVTTDTFEKFVQDKEVALIDFSASWCGPCKALKPVVDAIADEYEDRAAVGVVDVDEEPALSAAFRISAVPTLIFFQGGEPVGAMQGAVGREALSEQLDKMLSETS